MTRLLNPQTTQSSPNNTTAIGTFGDPTANGKATVILRRLAVVETGEYNDQHYRPYQFRAGQEELNLFAEITQNQNRVSPSEIAGIAGRMLQPSAIAGGVASIANGWGARRCRFLMAIDFQVGLGAWVREIVTGYTDYNGVIKGAGSKACFDREMRFYINNTVTVDSVVRPGPSGSMNTYRMIDNAHLITPMMNNHGDLLHGYGSATLSLIRPHDVVGYMQTDNLTGEVHDTRNRMIGMAAKKSRRSNNLPSEFISRTVNAVAAAEEYANHLAPANGDSQVSSLQEINRARGDLKEPLANADLFIRMLHNRTGFQTERNFTFGELLKLFANADDDHVTTFNPRGALQRQKKPGEPKAFIDDFTQPGSTEFMNRDSSKDIACSVATKLSALIPALMMDLLITEINFEINNETINGIPFVKISAVQTFENVDKKFYGQLFIQRVESEVIPDITRNGFISFMAFLYVDILGDTNIRVSIAGKEAVDFKIPTFSDGLFTPVISDASTALGEVAHDVKVLASQLTGVSNRSLANSLVNPNGQALGANSGLVSSTLINPNQQLGNNNAIPTNNTNRSRLSI